MRRLLFDGPSEDQPRNSCNLAVRVPTPLSSRHCHRPMRSPPGGGRRAPVGPNRMNANAPSVGSDAYCKTTGIASNLGHRNGSRNCARDCTKFSTVGTARSPSRMPSSSECRCTVRTGASAVKACGSRFRESARVVVNASISQPPRHARCTRQSRICFAVLTPVT